MTEKERLYRHQQLIGQVREAAAKKGWVPKGQLIHTVEELEAMLCDISKGNKPRVFKAEGRGPKPGWKERRKASALQLYKLGLLCRLTGEPISMAEAKTWTYAQAEGAIIALREMLREMEEEREAFDVGCTSR